jgi:dimethylamine/trimethylamine dehydrogenase
MARTFPGYVGDFLRLEAMAPCEDLPRLKLLTAHEVAAIAFLDLELLGAQGSVAPLSAYLEKDIT